MTESHETPRCSAKGCTRDAGWQLLWNNPKIHPAERRKNWLACEDHRGSLADFLGARGFLREVEPMPTGTTGHGGQDPEAPAEEPA